MSYIDTFLPGSAGKPMTNATVAVIEKDWQFLKEVFPEPGFRSYFLAHIVTKLANELHEQGIESYFERAARPELANIPGLLSNIVITKQAAIADDRRGAGAARGADEVRERVAASTPQSPGRQAEESQGSEGGESARPLIAGLTFEQAAHILGANNINKP